METELLVVGGGPAGCSAAVMARSLGVDVAVVERRAVGSRVRSAPVVENLLGGPRRGEELAAAWEQHLAAASVPVVHDTVVVLAAGGSERAPWVATLAEGGAVGAQAVVVATGGRDLTLGEHVGPGAVAGEFRDTFLATSSYDAVTAAGRVVVVGCDRPLLSLVDSGALDGRGVELVVLALPALRYVLDAERRELPFDVIDAAGVEGVRRSGGDWTVAYRHDDGREGEVAGDLVVTNLGAVPNVEWLGDVVGLGPDGYVAAATLPPGLFVAGDVGHRGYQRISVAIGEGARAVLEYFYRRQGVRQPN